MSLKRAGYDVSLVAFGNLKNHNADDTWLKKLFPPITKPLLRLIGNGAGIVRSLIKLRPALVHLHDPELIPLCLALRALGVKVILDIHENYLAENSAEHKPENKPKRAIQMLLRSTLKIGTSVADGVVVAGEDIAQEAWSKKCKNKLAIVQNYPIISSALLSARTECRRYERPRIAFLGGISAKRAIEEYVISLGKVTSRWECVVAGNNNDLHLLAKISKHAAWAGVDYRGRLRVRATIRPYAWA